MISFAQQLDLLEETFYSAWIRLVLDSRASPATHTVEDGRILPIEKPRPKSTSHVELVVALEQ